MKKNTALKVADLRRSKDSLPRTVKDAELKALAGGRMPETGGTCSDTADCDA
jgi:hypothetical protein